MHAAVLQVFYLGYAGLKQVDLSDDQVVAAIAVDDWENAMIPVEVRTDNVFKLASQLCCCWLAA